MASVAALQRARNRKPNLNQVKPGQGGSEPKHVPGKGKPRKTPVANPPHGMNGKGPKQNKGKGAKHTPAPTAETYAQRDPDYRRAIAGYRTNLANLRTQNRAQRADLGSDYTTTRARLMEAFGQNDKAQTNDFAARGLFGSGVYAKAKTDRQKQETNQLTDASSSYSRNARQLDTDLSNATTLERQQESTAKAAAIRRASAKYGITGQPARARRRRRK